MTFIWLIVWLIAGVPQLHQWNGWLVALLVCLAIDVLGGGSRSATRRR